MANPTFYLSNLETWTNAQDMDVESWLADVYQVADITQLPYHRVAKLKTNGMAKGWVERWALECATDGSKEKFSTDFRAEIARPRTAASTYAEIMSIKQKTGELTDRYIARMKANIKLLLLTSKPDATPYTLTEEAEATFSIAFCRGLMSGHPFKVKNRDPEPTLTGTYTAVAKYCRHNQYEEETYEDKIRKDAERLTPRPTTGAIEIAGTKIPAAEFQAFRKDFEPETLTAEVDEMVKMFESWSLASLEDQTPAGRVARTIARLPVAVARKVFGHTRFAQHIRGSAIETPASRQVVQSSATPAPTGPRLCHKCQAEGHYANQCPTIECYHCHEKGHVSRLCPNNSTTPATGPNSIPLTSQNSMRVQSIEIDHALAAQRTTRSMGGVDQKRRQERVNLPVGPKAKKNVSPEKSKVIDRDMDWEEGELISETLNDATGIGHIENSDRGERRPTGVVTIEPVTEEAIDEDAVRKRRARQKVEPDPVFVSSIENLTFDIATISKHGGRIPSQLKAAVSRVYANSRERRKKARAKSNPAQAAPTPITVANRGIAVSRKALGDVTTVRVNGRSYPNAIIDPGNDRTMMGLHVAQDLGLELKPANRGILLADGRFDNLAGSTGPIKFYVQGFGGQMDMGVIDCKRSYDFLLGDDWLAFVGARAAFSGGKRYYVRKNGVNVYLGANDEPRSDSSGSEEYSDDDYSDEDSDEEYESDESTGDTKEGFRAMRVRSFELSDISIQARSVEAVNLQSKESPVSSPVKSPVESPELPQFKVGDVVVDINPALEMEKRVQMIELLERNRDRFTMDMQDLEVTTVLEHEVNVIPGSKPVYVGWSPRYAPKEMEFLKKSISEELATGKIVEMESEWCAPLSLAPKKDGSLRKCVAYVGLNKVTERESWPLPSIEHILDELAGHHYYSSLDGFQGYYVIGVKKEHRKYLGFRTPFGTYAYTVMPFGLKNAPHTFSRFIQKVYGNLIGTVLNAYMDDVCNRDMGWDEHLDGLDRTFAAARKGGVKYKASKLHFGYDKVEFTGHIVGRDGIQVMPDKVEKVLNFVIMDSKGQVRAFLGLTGYYRRFIWLYAKLAEPLNRLLRKGVVFVMGPEQLESMRNLQEAIVTSPVLKGPDFGRDWIMPCDACDYAVGSVLEQEDENGEVRPVFFYSKTLHGPELNYSTSEKECLAIVFSVKKFRPYILGRSVVVFTDHAPLKWLFSKTDLTGRPARWQMTLAEFDLIIRTKPGAKNGNADGMSRLTVREEVAGDDIDDEMPECLGMRAVSMDDKWAECRWYRNIFTYLTTGTLRLEDYNEARRAKRRAFRFRVDAQEGLLYRDADNVEKQCVVESEVEEKLSWAHDVGGHYGAEATLAAIRTQGWWPTMRKDVFDWVKSCRRCQQFGPREKHNLLHPSTPDFPFEILFVDLIEDLPRTTRGMTSIVVFTDSFTKWTEACAIPNKSAASVKAALFLSIMCRFGLPVVIRSDGGPAFRTEFKEMCEAWGIKHLVGSTRHPQSQGQVEATNKLIEERLRRSMSTGAEWDVLLPKAVYDINHRVVGSTKMSPSEALMGFVGRSALRQSFSDDRLFTTTGGIEPVHEELEGAMARFVCRREGLRELAYENRMNANEKAKRYYDRRVKVVKFEKGERVWVFNLAFVTGFGKKLTPRWLGPFEVVWVGRTGAYGVKTGRTHYGTKDGVETMSGDMLKEVVERRVREERKE